MGMDPSAWTSLVLLERVRSGDDRAAAELFARYFERLTALARCRIAPTMARRIDPEDIVLSAYRSFFVAARAGRYTLGRGGDLWRLLAAITRHKLSHQIRHHAAERRAVGGDVSLEGIDPAADPALVAGSEAEAAVALADELAWVLTRLEPLAGRVLELRLRGDSIAEIATAIGRAERTVRRALAQIRAELAGRLGDG